MVYIIVKIFFHLFDKIKEEDFFIYLYSKSLSMHFLHTFDCLKYEPKNY